MKMDEEKKEKNVKKEKNIIIQRNDKILGLKQLKQIKSKHEMDKSVQTHIVFSFVQSTVDMWIQKLLKQGLSQK